jgi:hypothetical protein
VHRAFSEIAWASLAAPGLVASFLRKIRLEIRQREANVLAYIDGFMIFGFQSRGASRRSSYFGSRGNDQPA